MELGWQGGGATAGRSERRKLAAAALLVTSLGMTAWLFWQWQATRFPLVPESGAAAEHFAVFDAADLNPAAIARLQSAPGAAPRTVVVHLRDSACACNPIADEHFLALVARRQADGVVFAVAEAPGRRSAPARGMERLPHLTPAESELLWRNLPAVPAAAVFDPAGTPVYLGPYTDLGRCGAARGGPVEAAMAKAQRESTLASPQAMGTMGCICSRSATVGQQSTTRIASAGTPVREGAR